MMLNIFSCDFFGGEHQYMFGKVFVEIVCLFFIWLLYFSLNFESSLQILDSSLLPDMWFADILS